MTLSTPRVGNTYNRKPRCVDCGVEFTGNIRGGVRRRCKNCYEAYLHLKEREWKARKKEMKKNGFIP